MGADRRDDVHRLADERDAIAAGRLRRHAREREDAARADVADGAEHALQALLERLPERRLFQCGKLLGNLGTFDPDEARCAPRRRHHREGPRRPMELGRDAAMRPLVRESAGHGALLVGPSLDGDLRCLSAEGLAAVGADDELGGQCAAVGEANFGSGIADDNLSDVRVHQRQVGQFPAAPPQRLDEAGIRHVVAKALQACLGGGEGYLRRAQQRPHVVDDADAGDGLPVVPAHVADAQVVQQRDRPGKQRRCTRVAAGWRGADGDDAHAQASERQSGRQSRRAGADDGNFE